MNISESKIELKSYIKKEWDNCVVCETTSDSEKIKKILIQVIAQNIKK